MNEQVAAIVNTWPKEPQESAKRLIEYYGEPDEYSPSQLIWYNTKDGWKRTVLTKEEIPHKAPSHKLVGKTLTSAKTPPAELNTPARPERTRSFRLGIGMHGHVRLLRASR